MNQFAVALTLLTFHVAVLPRAHLSQAHVSKCSDDCSLAGQKLDQFSDPGIPLSILCQAAKVRQFASRYAGQQAPTPESSELKTFSNL